MAFFQNIVPSAQQIHPPTLLKTTPLLFVRDPSDGEAADFAERHGIPRICEGAEAMLKDIQTP